MSLHIDVDHVESVLVGNEWYTVADMSFDIDAYEFHHEDYMLQGGGNYGICASGFTFQEAQSGLRMAGPLTAIQAVLYRDAS